jgi:hypothetical protein
MLNVRKYKKITVYARFEVLTALAIKNAFFWDIKPQFIPHRKHITSPLWSPAG